MPIKSPFQNESETAQVGGMTIENRLDRVSFFGQIDITKDKKGLQDLKVLAALVNTMLTTMENTDLPDEIEIDATVKVKSPF